jgi:hypothetical protein
LEKINDVEQTQILLCVFPFFCVVCYCACIAELGCLIGLGINQVCVDPNAGSLETYVDGVLCHVSQGLDPIELRLQHKLVVLGGGKQAHVRGGDVFRVRIITAALNARGVMEATTALWAEHPTIGGLMPRLQARWRGMQQRVADAIAREKESHARAEETRLLLEKMEADQREKELQEKRMFDEMEEAATPAVIENSSGSTV